MGKFSRVLFSSDFDHTLSGMDGTVPEKNIDAIRYFIAEGGRFMINSGRSIPLLRPKLDLIPVNAPCLCYNGAACYDFSAERLFYAHPLPDFAREILAAAKAYDPTLAMEVQRLDSHYAVGVSTARSAFLLREGIVSIHSDSDIPLPWMKLVVCSADDDNNILEDPNHVAPEVVARMEALTQHLRTFCAGQCYVTRSMPRVIEIGLLGCDKGSAARKLAEQLDCTLVASAGDAPNDLEMLQSADFAFAPTDCDPSIRTLSGLHLTAPCGEGAVAEAIAQLERLL